MSVSTVYTQCAQDGGECNFPGKQSIAYSTGTGVGSTLFRNPTSSIKCDPSSFNNNDPAPNIIKNCYRATIPQDIIAPSPNFYDTNGRPAGWTQCALEGQICNPGTGSPVDILFGANSSYVYANATSTPCDDITFGDPSVGNGKACYWRTTPNPTPTPTPNPTPTPTPTPTPSLPNRSRYLYIGIGIFVLLLILILIIILIKRKSGSSAAVTSIYN